MDVCIPLLSERKKDKGAKLVYVYTCADRGNHTHHVCTICKHAIFCRYFTSTRSTYDMCMSHDIGLIASNGRLILLELQLLGIQIFARPTILIP